jgi:hypothetical protein
MFLTLDSYNYNKTNVIPPPLTQPVLVQLTPLLPLQVEFQPNATQQPIFLTLPALLHARLPPFQYPLPLALSRIPSFPPYERQFVPEPTLSP